MSGVIGNSVWTDAGNYGAGLGQTLGQALLQMPQQRAQLAMQQAQMQQEQQRAMLNYALQQRAQMSQQQLGSQELSLKQQELRQNEEAHRLSQQAEMLKAQNEAKGTYKFGETKEGVPYLMNTTTGEHKWIQSPEGGGLGYTPPMTQNQRDERLQQYLRLAGGAQVNDWNNPTNAMNPYFQMITNRISGLNAGNVPQGLQAPAAPTNAPSPYKIIQMGQ